MTSSATLAKTSRDSDQLTSTLPTGSARGRFVVNVGSNVGFLVISTLVAMWFTPFLIDHLGISTYGVVSLALAVIPFMLIVTNSLNSAFNRFLAIDLNRGDEARANRTFNTAIAGSIGIIGALVPLIIALVWLFPRLFEVPRGLENESRLLFGLVTLSFILTAFSSNFGVSMVILHRFDLRNQINILALASRVGLVVLLFALLSDRLWHVGAAFVVASVVTLVGEWFWWRRLTPQIRVRPSDFDRARFRELFGLGGWAMINSLGMLLLINVSLVVVNRFFGPEMTGRFGALLLFAYLIRTLAGTVSTTISPAVMARYAAKDFDGLRRLASRGVKLMGLGIALPVGLLCGFARPLLGIWLGPDFEALDILLIVLVAHLTINVATLPLSYVLTSYNKVRIQGIATLFLGLVGLILAIVFARWSSLGIVSIAAASAIVWTIRNLVFVSGYSAHVMSLPLWTYASRLIAGIVGMLAVSYFSYALTRFWAPGNWLTLAGMAIAISLGYVVAVYFIGLDHDERQLFSSLLRAPFRGGLKEAG